VRHRFIADFVADAPQHSWARKFEFSSIVTIETPRPFTLFVGFDANNDGNPVTDRVGSSQRNTYFGGELRTWDARLSRTFTIPDHAQLRLAVDGFNLLNRANIDEVYSVYGAPDFIGTVPQHYKDGVTSPGRRLFWNTQDCIQSQTTSVFGKAHVLIRIRSSRSPWRKLSQRQALGNALLQTLAAKVVPMVLHTFRYFCLVV
jgi:hypothetical protein